MTASNPLTAVYDALWTLLEAHAPLTALVKTANRIKFTGEAANPDKQEILTADLPYIRLICTGGSPHIQRTSNSGSLTKRFEVQIATGAQGLNATAGLLAVEWEVLRAMHGWQAVLGALTWQSKAYVKLCKPLEIAEALTNIDLNQGIKGWAAVWGCEVEMWFTTTDLAPVPA